MCYVFWKEKFFVQISSCFNSDCEYAGMLAYYFNAAFKGLKDIAFHGKLISKLRSAEHHLPYGIHSTTCCSTQVNMA